MNEFSHLWSLVLAGDLDSARATATTVVRVANSRSGPVDESTAPRWERAADAEELLAAVAYLSGDFGAAVAHSQQAIMHSSRFRPGVSLLSGFAQRALGQAELASSKFEIVASHSDDLCIAALASEQTRSNS